MLNKGCECPRCGKFQKEYIVWGKSPAPMCMSCHRFVSEDLLPKECIKHLPAKKQYKKTPSELGRKAYHPEYPEYREPEKVRKDSEERLSRDDVKMMVEDTLDKLYKKREERESEKVLKRMDDRIKGVESTMDDIHTQMNKKISESLERRKQAEYPKEPTSASERNMGYLMKRRQPMKFLSEGLPNLLYRGDRIIKGKRSKQKK